MEGKKKIWYKLSEDSESDSDGETSSSHLRRPKLTHSTSNFVPQAHSFSSTDSRLIAQRSLSQSHSQADQICTPETRLTRYSLPEGNSSLTQYSTNHSQTELQQDYANSSQFYQRTRQTLSEIPNLSQRTVSPSDSLVSPYSIPRSDSGYSQNSRNLSDSELRRISSGSSQSINQAESQITHRLSRVPESLSANRSAKVPHLNVSESLDHSHLLLSQNSRIAVSQNNVWFKLNEDSSSSSGRSSPLIPTPSHAQNVDSASLRDPAPHSNDKYRLCTTVSELITQHPLSESDLPETSCHRHLHGSVSELLTQHPLDLLESPQLVAKSQSCHRSVLNSSRASTFSEITQHPLRSSDLQETAQHSLKSSEIQEFESVAAQNQPVDLQQITLQSLRSLNGQEITQHSLRPSDVQEITQHPLRNSDVQEISQHSDRSSDVQEITQHLLRNSDVQEISQHSNRSSDVQEITHHPLRNSDVQEINQYSKRSPDVQEITQHPFRNSDVQEISQHSKRSSDVQEITQHPSRNSGIQIISQHHLKSLNEHDLSKSVSNSDIQNITQHSPRSSDVQEITQHTLRSSDVQEITQHTLRSSDVQEITQHTLRSSDVQEITQHPFRSSDVQEITQHPLRYSDVEEITQHPLETSVGDTQGAQEITQHPLRSSDLHEITQDSPNLSFLQNIDPNPTLESSQIKDSSLANVYSQINPCSNTATNVSNLYTPETGPILAQQKLLTKAHQSSNDPLQVSDIAHTSQLSLNCSERRLFPLTESLSSFAQSDQSRSSLPQAEVVVVEAMPSDSKSDHIALQQQQHEQHLTESDNLESEDVADRVEAQNSTANREFRELAGTGSCAQTSLLLNQSEISEVSYHPVSHDTCSSQDSTNSLKMDSPEREQGENVQIPLLSFHDSSREDFASLQFPSPRSGNRRMSSDDEWRSETDGTTSEAEGGSPSHQPLEDLALNLSHEAVHEALSEIIQEQAVQTVVSEISKDFVSGNLSMDGGQSSDSSQLSSDKEEQEGEQEFRASISGLYPETYGGLSDIDWNIYTSNESDNNITPRSAASSGDRETPIGGHYDTSVETAGSMKPRPDGIVSNAKIDIGRIRNESADGIGREERMVDVYGVEDFDVWDGSDYHRDRMAVRPGNVAMGQHENVNIATGRSKNAQNVAEELSLRRSGNVAIEYVPMGRPENAANARFENFEESNYDERRNLTGAKSRSSASALSFLRQVVGEEDKSVQSQSSRSTHVGLSNVTERLPVQPGEERKTLDSRSDRPYSHTSQPVIDSENPPTTIFSTGFDTDYGERKKGGHDAQFDQKSDHDVSTESGRGSGSKSASLSEDYNLTKNEGDEHNRTGSAFDFSRENSNVSDVMSPDGKMGGNSAKICPMETEESLTGNGQDQDRSAKSIHGYTPDYVSVEDRERLMFENDASSPSPTRGSLGIQDDSSRHDFRPLEPNDNSEYFPESTPLKEVPSPPSQMETKQYTPVGEKSCCHSLPAPSTWNTSSDCMSRTQDSKMSVKSNVAGAREDASRDSLTSNFSDKSLSRRNFQMLEQTDNSDYQMRQEDESVASAGHLNGSGLSGAANNSLQRTEVSPRNGHYSVGTNEDTPLDSFSVLDYSDGGLDYLQQKPVTVGAPLFSPNASCRSSTPTSETLQPPDINSLVPPVNLDLREDGSCLSLPEVIGASTSEGNDTKYQKSEEGSRHSLPSSLNSYTPLRQQDDMTRSQSSAFEMINGAGIRESNGTNYPLEKSSISRSAESITSIPSKEVDRILSRPDVYQKYSSSGSGLGAIRSRSEGVQADNRSDLRLLHGTESAESASRSESNFAESSSTQVRSKSCISSISGVAMLNGSTTETSTFSRKDGDVAEESGEISSWQDPSAEHNITTRHSRYSSKPQISFLDLSNQDYKRLSAGSPNSDFLSRKVESLLSNTAHLADHISSTSGNGETNIRQEEEAVTPRDDFDYDSLHRELDEIQDSLKTSDSYPRHMPIERLDIGNSTVDTTPPKLSHRSVTSIGSPSSTADLDVSRRRFYWDYGADIGYTDGQARFIGNIKDITGTEENLSLQRSRENNTPTSFRSSDERQGHRSMDLDEADETVTDIEEETLDESDTDPTVLDETVGILTIEQESKIQRQLSLLRETENLISENRQRKDAAKEREVRSSSSATLVKRVNSLLQLDDPHRQAVNMLHDVSAEEKALLRQAAERRRELDDANDSDMSYPTGTTANYSRPASLSPRRGVASSPRFNKTRSPDRYLASPTLQRILQKNTTSSQPVSHQNPFSPPEYQSALQNYETGSSSAFSHAKSFLCGQLAKMSTRQFDQSIELRSPVRRTIDCYPVYGAGRPDGQESEEDSTRPNLTRESRRDGSQRDNGQSREAAGNDNVTAQQQYRPGSRTCQTDSGRERSVRHSPPGSAQEGLPTTGMVTMVTASDRSSTTSALRAMAPGISKNGTVEKYSSSPEYGTPSPVHPRLRTLDQKSSPLTSDLASSPSDISTTSPSDSDYSAARKRDLASRYRPYRPVGSKEVYYTESETDERTSVADSVTTMESTHAGSDDARAPDFPSHVLGSREDVNTETPGIYGSRKPGAYPASLSTIEERSLVDDKEKTPSIESANGRPRETTPDPHTTGQRNDVDQEDRELLQRVDRTLQQNADRRTVPSTKLVAPSDGQFVRGGNPDPGDGDDGPDAHDKNDKKSTAFDRDYKVDSDRRNDRTDEGRDTRHPGSNGGSGLDGAQRMVRRDLSTNVAGGWQNMPQHLGPDTTGMDKFDHGYCNSRDRQETVGVADVQHRSSMGLMPEATTTSQRSSHEQLADVAEQLPQPQSAQSDPGQASLEDRTPESHQSDVSLMGRHDSSSEYYHPRRFLSPNRFRSRSTEDLSTTTLDGVRGSSSMASHAISPPSFFRSPIVSQHSGANTPAADYSQPRDRPTSSADFTDLKSRPIRPRDRELLRADSRNNRRDLPEDHHYDMMSRQELSPLNPDDDGIYRKKSHSNSADVVTSDRQTSEGRMPSRRRENIDAEMESDERDMNTRDDQLNGANGLGDSEQDLVDPDKIPMGRTAKLLQHAIEREGRSNSGLPPDVNAFWERFQQMQSDSDSSMDSTRLTTLANLLKNPAKHVVKQHFSEQEMERRRRAAWVENQREERRKEDRERKKVAKVFQQEIVDGSYSETLDDSNGYSMERSRERDGKGMRKRDDTSMKMYKRELQYDSSSTIDALYSIAEDPSLDMGRSPGVKHAAASPSLKRGEKRQRHVIDPNMEKLKTKINKQKVKYEKHRRRKQQYLAKIERLEELLIAKRSGKISKRAFEKEIANLSSSTVQTTSSTSSEISSEMSQLSSLMQSTSTGTESTLVRTLSSDQSCSTITPRTTSDDGTLVDLGWLPANMKEKGRQSNDKGCVQSGKLDRPDAGRKPTLKDASPVKLKQKKARREGSLERSTKKGNAGTMSEPPFKTQTVQYERQASPSRGWSPSKAEKVRKEKENQRHKHTRDAAVNYPSPTKVSPKRKSHKHMVSEGVQTTPKLAARSRSRSRSMSPSRKLRQETSSVPYENTRKRADRVDKHRSTSPKPSRARSLGSDSQENKPPRKARRSSPGMAWFVPMDEPRPWRKPLKERQALARSKHPDAQRPRAELMLDWRTAMDENIFKPRKKASTQETTEDNSEMESFMEIYFNRDRNEQGEKESDEWNPGADDFKPLSKMTLQEAFLACKQNFISQSKERQRRIALASRERCLQEVLEEERERLFMDQRPQDVNPNAHPYSERLYRPKKRCMSKEEMRELTNRLYRQLPEVIHSKMEEKRAQDYKANRIRAKFFNKKVQRKALGKPLLWYH